MQHGKLNSELIGISAHFFHKIYNRPLSDKSDEERLISVDSLHCAAIDAAHPLCREVSFSLRGKYLLLCRPSTV